MISVRNGYLLAYNGIQFVGWASILLRTLRNFLAGVAVRNIYGGVLGRVELFQTLAILEILHAALGVVRSPPLTTAIQVFSRLLLVWPVAHNVIEARTSTGAFLFTVAWSVTEVVRYAYYATGQLNCTPRFLTWLRYTLFLVLYPLGITGELMAIFVALTPIKQRRLSSVEMPNNWNVSFNFYLFLLVILPLYPFVFAKLYMYMINQRKKVLSADTKKLL